MKNIRFFLSENFHFLVVKFSVYLHRLVFVMISTSCRASVLFYWEGNIYIVALFPAHHATSEKESTLKGWSYSSRGWGWGSGWGGGSLPIWSSSGMCRWNRYNFQACDYMISYQF